VIGDVDIRTARMGALVILAILEPPVQIVNAVNAGDESYWWVIGAVAVLASFVVGGGFVARRQPRTPFQHAAAAAALAFVIHMVVRTLVRAVSGDSLSVAPVNTLLVAQIAISLSLLGAYVAGRRRSIGTQA
jgi:hypothetical protein